MIQFVKNWLLPLAMLTGALLHRWIGALTPVTPFLLFVMLLLTFCRISIRDLRLRGLHVFMLLLQIGGGFVAYLILRQFNEILAQGILLCMLVPPGTATPVVTAMLGGDIAFGASFLFFSNVGVAVAAPAIFAFIGFDANLTFCRSAALISGQVVPILVLPLALAWIIQKTSPKLHGWMVSKAAFSLYLWGIFLTIVTGSTVNFVLHQPDPDYANELLLALGSLIVCIILFVTGKTVGGLFHERIAAGQALGQKNTVLAIWMAFTYTHPLASLGPAAYVLWQNLFNSWQLWRRQRAR